MNLITRFITSFIYLFLKSLRFGFSLNQGSLKLLNVVYLYELKPKTFDEALNIATFIVAYFASLFVLKSS